MQQIWGFPNSQDLLHMSMSMSMSMCVCVCAYSLLACNHGCHGGDFWCSWGQAPPSLRQGPASLFNHKCHFLGLKTASSEHDGQFVWVKCAVCCVCVCGSPCSAAVCLGASMSLVPLMSGPRLRGLGDLRHRHATLRRNRVDVTLCYTSTGPQSAEWQGGVCIWVCPGYFF